MNLSIKLCIFAACMAVSAFQVQAQHTPSESEVNRHSIKFSYSDGLTLGGASFWGIGLADAITGTRRIDQKSTGVFGIGYRYAFNRRFKLGMDLGFAQVSSKIEDNATHTAYLKEKELNLMVLPTAELVYFKRSLFELYGSASAGLNFTRHHETGLTEKGREVAQKKSVFDTGIAYQINPIGVRVGNSSVGGFVEAGLGHRGFLTAGLSLSF